MSNNNPKPSLMWWIMITVAAGCIIFMVVSTVQSIAKILWAPVPAPPVAALMDTPDRNHDHAEIKTAGIAVPAPIFPDAAAAPRPQQERKPHKNNITTNFEQMIRIEQEKQQVYQSLREQAKANPGQPGTLTEEAIRKLEKKEKPVTGVSRNMKTQDTYSGLEATGNSMAISLSYPRAAGQRVRSTSLQAFTLLETMIAATLFLLVTTGMIEVFIMCNKYWHSTSLSMQTGQMVNLAISRMITGYGTNMGIRGAEMVMLQTNVYGHPYPFLATNKYWETGGMPPDASDSSHYAHLCCAYGTDGSWRLILSNEFDGIMCIDYNSKMRNLFFCPDTNQTSAARQKRILICNYVSAAHITNSANQAVDIQLTVEKRDGMFITSNQASIFITKRN